MADIDWDDPCIRARELLKAKYRIISGQQEFEVEYRNADTTRRLRFSQSNASDLDAEIRRAQDECAVLTGGVSPRTRRFAINAGHRGFR